MRMQAMVVTLACLVTVPAAATPAKSGPTTAKTAESPAKESPAKDSAKDAAKDPDVARVAKLVASIRKGLETQAKAGAQPEMAEALLGSLLNLSAVNVLHGHFALAGVGQSVRTGGLPANVAQEFARNMRDSWKLLGGHFGQLAELKAFDADLRDIFRTLGHLSQLGEAAAGKLLDYAQDATDTAKAAAFESALEDYRGRTAAFLGAMKP